MRAIRRSACLHEDAHDARFARRATLTELHLDFCCARDAHAAIRHLAQADRRLRRCSFKQQIMYLFLQITTCHVLLLPCTCNAQSASREADRAVLPCTVWAAPWYCNCERACLCCSTALCHCFATEGFWTAHQRRSQRGPSQWMRRAGPGSVWDNHHQMLMPSLRRVDT